MTRAERNLVEAVERGDRATVVRLLETGVAPTPAALLSVFDAPAAVREHLVLALLDAGLEADAARTPTGETALARAVKLRDLGVIRVLLSAGADVLAPTEGTNVAMLAARDPELLALLGKAAAARAERTPTMTPPAGPAVRLFEAVTRDDVRAAREALRSGVAPDSVDPQGRTALHLASEAGAEAMVELLLEAGAPVDAATPARRVPLHGAAAANRVKVVRRLIAAGAAIDARDSQQRTPLWLACHALKVDSIELLVAAGADARAVDEFGETPAAIVEKAVRGATGRARRSAELAAQALQRSAAPPPKRRRR